MSTFRCDICQRKIEEHETFQHKDLENFENSIDVCRPCIRNKNRLNIYHQILDAPYGLLGKCDFCKENIVGAYNVINSNIVICFFCLPRDLSLEQINDRVNDLIYDRIYGSQLLEIIDT